MPEHAAMSTTLGAGHCCICTRVCHHIGGPYDCGNHVPRQPLAGAPMVVQPMPPPEPPDPDPLVEEIATMLVCIERNYYREGTGYGSRFAGQRLEVAQTRAVIRRVRQQDERSPA